MEELKKQIETKNNNDILANNHGDGMNDTTTNYLPQLLKILLALFCLGVFFVSTTLPAMAEGSGTWGTATDRQSWLWIPEYSEANSATNNHGYGSRGYMMLPSTVPNYNPDHRMYVYVKDGETVYWGFRKFDGANTIRVRWYYDSSDTGFFPQATSGPSYRLKDDESYNAKSAGGTTGRPANGMAAAIGPTALPGNSGGYSAYSFTNDTGADRAFWVEISGDDSFKMSYWDVTVADGSIEKPGRLYCKYWSVFNELAVALGQTNQYSFHDNFGFYVPVDDNFGGTGDQYFVKNANFGRSNGGYVNFFANQDGPRNDTGSHVENRKSIVGVSSNYQYPLFLNDPDLEFWPTTDVPNASLNITYEEKEPIGNGGHAWVDISISLPGIVDVLIDLDGNNTYDEGIDIVISERYDASGNYQIYWDGKDANGDVVTSGSKIGVFAAVIFAPVHFPVYDMEQSLGITITNVRPGNPEDNAIYWDDSPLPRDGEPGFSAITSTSGTSAVSAEVNVTGEAGTSHIWHSDSNKGFGEKNTINTWAASYYAEVQEEDEYLYLTYQGNVYEDDNGLEDGLVSGIGTNLEGQLYVLIVDTDNKVINSAAVASNGCYSIDHIPDGSYKAVLSTSNAAHGEPSPLPSLPQHWENSGEQLGTEPGVNLYGNDGVLGAFSLENTSVVEANFGLRTMGTLPVIWEDFEAEYNEQKNVIDLEWTVAKEWENSHYEIERSALGLSDFIKIGEVTAVGWSDEAIDYNFEDATASQKAGKWYYRIRQVDLDGSDSYSSVLAAQMPVQTSKGPTWSIYPNPGHASEINIALNKFSSYNGEPLHYRLVSSLMTTDLYSVSSPDLLSQSIQETLTAFPSGLVIVEILWADHTERLKLMLR